MGLQTGMINSRFLQISAFFIALAIAFSFGFSYGNVGNQETYLPHALNFVNPHFLENDWLVRDTTAYHSSFRWIILALAKTGALGWAAAILNTLLIAFSLIMLYQIIAVQFCGNAVVATVLALLFITLDRTATVGSSYLFADGLQPSTLATAAWFVAIFGFLRGRYVLAGCLLAIGGLFHANFLVLGIGLFTLAHLLLNKGKRLVNLAAQIGPSLLILLFFLPLILAAANGEGAQQAREIFLVIRSPHHYVPLTYLPQFLYLTGWFLCGLSALLAMPDLPSRRSLMALVLALAISIGGATMLTTLVFVPPVSQLFVWRLAPFLLVLSQISVAIFMVQLLQLPTFEKKHSRLLFLIALSGALAILRWVAYAGLDILRTAAAVLPILAYLGVFFAHRKSLLTSKQALFAVGGAGMLAVSVLTVSRIPSVFDKSTLLHPNTNRLYEWAHSTDERTIFLLPPELGDFRLLAGRPVVVDWKSTPVKADELLNWYHRINDIAGKPVFSFNDAVQGYRSHGLSELHSLAAHYNASYIIVDRKRHHLEGIAEVPVFSDETYSVFAASPHISMVSPSNSPR